MRDPLSDVEFIELVVFGAQFEELIDQLADADDWADLREPVDVKGRISSLERID